MRSVRLGCLVFGVALGVACGGNAPEPPKTEDKAAKPAKPAPKPCDPKDLIPVKPETVPESLEVQHILIAYKGSGAAKNPQIKVTRSKEEARKLWEKVFEEARNCADFNKLVIQYSDDPYKMNDSKYNAFPGFYEITPKGVFDENFKKCAQGLSPGNIDKVESYYGFHIIRRKA